MKLLVQNIRLKTTLNNHKCSSQTVLFSNSYSDPSHFTRPKRIGYGSSCKCKNLSKKSIYHQRFR